MLSKTVLAAFFAMMSLCPIAAAGQAPGSGKIGPVDDKALPDVVVQMLKIQIAWDAGMISPSKLRLTFQKLPDITNEKGHYFHYRVFAVGAPEGGPYTMQVWKIGTSLDSMTTLDKNVYVNRKGLLFTNRPKPDQRDIDSVDDDSDFDVAVQVSLGEPVRFLLSGKKGKELIPGTLVPAPVEASNNGCKLRALLGSPAGEAILMSGEGFPANADLILKGDSSGEQLTAQQHSDANGEVHWTELPYVIGKDNGILKDTLVSSACTVTVEIPWGPENYRAR